ncbi:type IV pilus modification protein PilV [Marinobacter halodurans]|nr:type IV pilus modification protein PilV [Marinobacter halodurans]
MKIKGRGEKGFTMIEVLVALLILAIGLLGVVGVQALAMKSTTNSNVRSQVNLLAYDMVERIRANVPGVQAGAYDNITASKTLPGCGTSCTPTQMAAIDSNEWFSNLNSTLPGFTSASVKYASGVATITINWSERDLGNDAVNQSYKLDARILQ